MATSQNRIAGKTVIVTGASRGIGEAIAIGLSDMGVRLALIDVATDAVEAVARSIRSTGGDAVAITADLSDPDAIPDAVGRIRAEMGPVSGLVNKAGILQLKELADTTVADFDLTIAINLRAPNWSRRSRQTCARRAGDGWSRSHLRPERLVARMADAVSATT